MDKPTYFEDNYASKFLTGQTVFPDDARIFHRADCEYDDVAALGNARLEENVFTVDLFFRSGAAGTLTLRAVMPGILRVQFGPTGAAFDETSSMLEPFPQKRPALEFTHTPDAFTCRFGGYRVELDRLPFCLRILSPAGETIFESEWEKIVDMYTAPPLGLRVPRRSPGLTRPPAARPPPGRPSSAGACATGSASSGWAKSSPNSRRPARAPPSGRPIPAAAAPPT